MTFKTIIKTFIFQGDHLYDGEFLQSGQRITSPNQCFEAWLDTNGEFFTKRVSDGSKIWDANILGGIALLKKF